MLSQAYNYLKKSSLSQILYTVMEEFTIALMKGVKLGR